MAVVKASYRKGGSSGAVKYALHRDRDEEHEQSPREGFTADREGLDTRQSVDELKQHEQGKGYTYHIVLNAGDGKEAPTDLQQWTRDSMRALEHKHGREVPYVAVIHRDHSEHAHVHVIAHTDRTLRKDELNHTRSEASRLYSQQKSLYRDHYYDQQPEQDRHVEREPRHEPGAAEGQHRGGGPARTDPPRAEGQREGREARQPDQERAAQRQERQAEHRQPQRVGKYDGLEWQNTTRQQDADERWLASRPSLITSGAASREFAERYLARQQWIAQQQARRQEQRDEARDKWRAKADEWKRHRQETQEASRTGHKVLRDLGYGR